MANPNPEDTTILDYMNKIVDQKMLTPVPKSGPIDDWNAQADSANQWDSLDVDKKVDWLETWAKC